MKQWIITKILSIMGKAYVLLDKQLIHDKGPVLGLDIDDDFQEMSRKELCEYIENRFQVEKDQFWNLHSTQKIRFCCQIIRDNNLKK